MPRAAGIVRSFNGKPKATAWQPGANTVAFGLPLNDPDSTVLGIVCRLCRFLPKSAERPCRKPMRDAIAFP